MKSTLDKVLLALLMVVVVALAFVILGIAFSLISPQSAMNFTGGLQGSVLGVILGGLVGLLLLAGAFRIMVVFCTAGAEEKFAKTAPGSIVVKEGASGSLHVSLTAIDAMVKRYCQSNGGIRSCQTTVVPDKDGSIALKLKVVLHNDANIPEVTGALQSGLRGHVEEITGLRVNNIDVLVSSKQGPLK